MLERTCGQKLKISGHVQKVEQMGSYHKLKIKTKSKIKAKRHYSFGVSFSVWWESLIVFVQFLLSNFVLASHWWNVEKLSSVWLSAVATSRCRTHRSLKRSNRKWLTRLRFGSIGNVTVFSTAFGIPRQLGRLVSSNWDVQISTVDVSFFVFCHMNESCPGSNLR